MLYLHRISIYHQAIIGWNAITQDNQKSWHIDGNTKWSPFGIRHFTYIFLEYNVWISINISLKFVSKGPVIKIPALVQILATRHHLNQWWLDYQRLNELWGHWQKASENLLSIICSRWRGIFCNWVHHKQISMICVCKQLCYLTNWFYVPAFRSSIFSIMFGNKLNLVVFIHNPNIFLSAHDVSHIIHGVMSTEHVIPPENSEVTQSYRFCRDARRRLAEIYHFLASVSYSGSCIRYAWWWCVWSTTA